MKKYVKLDIMDDDLIMDTVILINPDTEKLDKLQKLLNHRFDIYTKFINYGAIFDYIDENFKTLKIDDFEEIYW